VTREKDALICILGNAALKELQKPQSVFLRNGYWWLSQVRIGVRQLNRLNRQLWTRSELSGIRLTPKNRELK